VTVNEPVHVSFAATSAAENRAIIVMTIVRNIKGFLFSMILPLSLLVYTVFEEILRTSTYI